MRSATGSASPTRGSNGRDDLSRGSICVVCLTRPQPGEHFSPISRASACRRRCLPGVLWARVQQDKAERITSAMLKDALAIAGLDFTDEQRAADSRRRQPEPDALRRAAADHDRSEHRAAAVLQPAGAGHAARSRGEAVPPEPAARAPPSRQSRGRRVLAAGAPRAAAEDAAGDVGRAHAHVPRSPQPLQRDAQFRRDLHRRTGDASRRSRPTGRSRPASIAGRCTACRGDARTSSPFPAFRRSGDRAPSRGR